MESKKEGNFLLNSPKEKNDKKYKISRKLSSTEQTILSSKKKEEVMCISIYFHHHSFYSQKRKKIFFLSIFSMRLRSRPNLEWKTISSYFSHRVLIILSFSLDTTTAHIFEQHSTRESWKFIPKKIYTKKESSRRGKKYIVYTLFSRPTLANVFKCLDYKHMRSWHRLAQYFRVDSTAGLCCVNYVALIFSTSWPIHIDRIDKVFVAVVVNWCL